MYSYIKEAVSKGYFNMDLISKALNTLKSKSVYHHLESQREDVTFERYDLDMAEFKYRIVDPTARVIRKRFIAYVEFDMITRNKVLPYRRSPFYRKEVSVFDIKDHPEIFDYNFLAFIDGRLVDFIHVIPSDRGTTVVFNRENGVDRYGLTQKQVEEFVQPGNTLTLFFIPNDDFGAYTIDLATLNKRANLLSLKETGITEHLGDEASFISFMNHNGMSFMSTILNHQRSGDLLRFNSKYISKQGDFQLGYYDIHSKEFKDSDKIMSTIERYPVSPNVKYKVITKPGYNVAIHEWDENGELVSSSNSSFLMGNPITVNTTPTTTEVSFLVKREDDKPIDLDVDSDMVSLVFSENNPTNIEDPTKAHLNIFGFKYLCKKVSLGAETEFFITDTKSPVPPENIILFFENEDGTHTFAHSVSVEYCYPTRYIIHGNTDGRNLVALVFYNKFLDEYLPDFNNDIQVYIDYVGYDNMHQIALNYKPLHVDYSIEDFEKSEHYPDYNAYKIAKFTEWYSFNLDYVKEYLKSRLSDYSGYYIDVKNINLNSRIRYSNRNEIENVFQQKDFDEPRYLFIFRNENPDIMEARIHIDGEVYYPDEVYKKGNYEYYYIPTDFVKEDSIIDIEKYKTYRHVIEFNPQSNSTSKIELPEYIQAGDNDLFLTTSDGTIIDRDLYTFYTKGNDGSYIPLSDITVDMSYIKSVYVEVDESLMNTDLKLYAFKTFAVKQFSVKDSYGSPTFIFEGNINPSKERFLIYYNRRLLPPKYYIIDRNGNNIKDSYSITIKGLLPNEGDTVTVFSLPVTLKTIVEEPTVTDTILDFRKDIELPFDLQWHELYINGKLLSTANIDNIAPKIISLNNINSNQNLLLLTKADYVEGLILDNVGSILDTLFDNDENFKNKVIESQDSIENNEEDIMKNIVVGSILDLMLFVTRDLEKFIGKINPDELQVTREFAQRYPEMITSIQHPHQDGEITLMMLNPDNNAEESERAFIISPRIQE